MIDLDDPFSHDRDCTAGILTGLDQPVENLGWMGGHNPQDR